MSLVKLTSAIRSKKEPLALFLLFLAVASIGIYFSRISFQFNSDEGRELMRALLFSKGYSLYNSIWSNQPPFFIYLASFFINIFGRSVVVIRLLVLAISFIGLYSWYKIIKHLCGSKISFLSLIFLLLSPVYIRLSISAMIVIPMIGFCLLSLWIFQIAIYKKSKSILFLSAVIFSLAIWTKLASVLFLPFFIFIFFADKEKNLLEKKHNYFLEWTAEAIIISLLLLFLPFGFNINKFYKFLILSHIKALPVKGADFGLILKFIKKDAVLYILSLAGTIVFWRKTQKFSIGLWSIICFYIIIMMSWHPIWHHYYLWFSLPLSWLAGIMSYYFGRQVYQVGYIKKIISFLIIIALLFILPWRIDWIKKSLYEPSSYMERKLMSFLSRTKKENDEFIITDYPMLAYKTGYLLPPEVAEISYKHRYNQKNLTDFLSLIYKYRPRLLLLGRNFFPENISDYLKNSYNLVDSYFLPNHSYFIPEYNSFLNWSLQTDKRENNRISEIERLALNEVLNRINHLLKDMETLLRGGTVRDYLKGIPYVFDYKNCNISIVTKKEYFKKQGVSFSAEYYIYYIFRQILSESEFYPHNNENCDMVFMKELGKMQKRLYQKLSTLEDRKLLYTVRSYKKYNLYVRK